MVDSSDDFGNNQAMIKFEKVPEETASRVPAAEKVLADDANILFAYLFGGLTRGEAKPLSDVDIAVYVRNAENLAEYKLDLFSRLSDALGTSELDLIVLNRAPVSLTGRILQNKRILSDKLPPARHSFESVVLREFFDFRYKEEAFFKRRYRVGR